MKFSILILLIFTVMLCSCSLFRAPEFERLYDIELNDLTPDHTNLYLSVVIRNPNWYSISVRSLDVDITDIADNKLGTIVMTKPLKIEKHSADTVYFSIQLITREVTKLISHSAQKVEFVIKAKAHAKVFGISKKIKLTQKQEINFTKILEQLLPSIPSEFELPTLQPTKYRKTVISNPTEKPSPLNPDIFKIIKTSISDIGLKETELTVKFVLLNPYGLSFTFTDFPAEVRINNIYAGRGKLAKPLIFDENVYQQEGVLVFKLNNFNSILLASRALMKKDMNYTVTGTLMAEGFGIKISKPFKFSGTVEVGKKDRQ